MHIPEGFLEAPVTATGSVVAVAGLAFCIARADLRPEDGRLPLAGLAGAFFLVGDSPFIPIGIGTQGHLLGGTLAVALLGPWLGGLTIAVVTIVQALVEGDGGITVLGLNIVNLALVPAFVGWPVLLLARRALGRSARSGTDPPDAHAAAMAVRAPARRKRQRSITARNLALACGAAAFVNVLLASCLFVAEFALGHKAPVSLSHLVTVTVGTYAVVAVIEAVVTAGIVRALLSRRPDLVLIAPPELRRSRRRRPRRAPAPDGAAGGGAGADPDRPVASGVAPGDPVPPPPPGCEPRPRRTDPIPTPEPTT